MDGECEFPKQNATTEEIRKILTSYKTVAVVGISDKPDRPSFRVASFLKDKGYRVIPVNPKLSEVLSEKAYPDLSAIPGEVEIVDVFRKPEDVGPVVDDAIAKKAKVIWMQEGIVNNEAADKARAAGLQVVMNKCMLKEISKL